MPQLPDQRWRQMNKHPPAMIRVGLNGQPGFKGLQVLDIAIIEPLGRQSHEFGSDVAWPHDAAPRRVAVVSQPSPPIPLQKPVVQRPTQITQIIQVRDVLPAIVAVIGLVFGPGGHGALYKHLAVELLSDRRDARLQELIPSPSVKASFPPRTPGSQVY